MAFIRTVEDFRCDHCHAWNVGDGYTNHCFRCLHSKHVDVDPGDRQAGCHGLMVPVGIDIRAGVVSVVHRCRGCRVRRRCRTAPGDNPDAVAAVSAGSPPPT